jgi:hypothetical protein
VILAVALRGFLPPELDCRVAGRPRPIEAKIMIKQTPSGGWTWRSNASNRIKIIDNDGLLTHEAMKLTTELAAENGISASEARNVLAALERKGYQIVKPN